MPASLSLLATILVETSVTYRDEPPAPAVARVHVPTYLYAFGSVVGAIIVRPVIAIRPVIVIAIVVRTIKVRDGDSEPMPTMIVAAEITGAGTAATRITGAGAAAADIGAADRAPAAADNCGPKPATCGPATSAPTPPSASAAATTTAPGAGESAIRCEGGKNK